MIVEDKEQMEKNYWNDINYLKEKLDAGADFVVTQLFYDVDIFIKWVSDCRSVGITAPIIPGIMPIMAYGGFTRMTSFCKTYVPPAVKTKVESLKDDDAGLKEYGIQVRPTSACMYMYGFGSRPYPGGEPALNLDQQAPASLSGLLCPDLAASVPAEHLLARTFAPGQCLLFVHALSQPFACNAST